MYHHQNGGHRYRLRPFVSARRHRSNCPTSAEASRVDSPAKTNAARHIYLWGSPLETEFHKILHIGRYARRANFGVENLSGLGYAGVKFWSLPLKWLVTLTTVLRYRAACD